MLSLSPRRPLGRIRTSALLKARTLPFFTPSALSDAAEGMSSNSFLSFMGTVPARANHPTSGYSVNVFEDGKAPAAAQTFGYSGKGCYDPTKRKVLWMCTGASYGIGNDSSGAYVYNTRPIYTESTDAWTCDRSFKATNEDTTAACISHQYDSNCINVNGRKLYKWHGFGGGIYEYDLDSGAMGALIDGPSGTNETVTAVWAMEFIPTRGTQGAIWLLAYETSANADLGLWEYTLHNSTWTKLLTNAQIEALGDVWTNGAPEYGPIMSYNPRAFSGVGAVMISGGSGVRIIRCSDLNLTNPGLGAAEPPDLGYQSGGFCRDPSGDGWIHMDLNTDRVWRYSSANGWENMIALDSSLAASGEFMVTPIDEFGVIFVACYNGGTPIGRLYKPGVVGEAGNALTFPHNDDADGFTAFQFTGANLLPAYPATYIWRVKVDTDVKGYHTTFFHGNGANDDTSFDAGDTYYGCHLYPSGADKPNSTDHNWEVSIDGGDWITDSNSYNTSGPDGGWYTQAAVITQVNTDELNVKFYWNLGAGTDRVIEYTTTSNFTLSPPPNPALTFGDAPWNRNNERLTGSLGQVKIFDDALSLSDIQSEAANMNIIATSAGSTNRWWFKPGFTSVDDLTDGVTGKSAAWATTNKATLGEAL